MTLAHPFTVDVVCVTRHYMDEAHVAYGKTPGDAAAVSALVHAMVKLNKVAGARYCCTLISVVRCLKVSQLIVSAGSKHHSGTLLADMSRLG